MSPKEKAKELILKFRTELFRNVMTQANMDMEREKRRDKEAAKFALIAVDEIIGSNPMSPKQGNNYKAWTDRLSDTIEYWMEVKKEIQA